MPIDTSSFPALLAPLPMAGTVLRNRVIHASMSTMMSERGRVTPAIIQYHVNRARGGAAMTVTEPLGMAAHQRNMPRAQISTDAWRDDFSRWAAAVEALDCRLIGQIQDAGRGRHYPGRTPDAIGASALPDDLSWTVPHALRADQVAALVEEFASSSARLQGCGFSGVEVSAGHGHLFHQFLSPWSNRREDRYGGDLAGRCRFVAELVAAIRALCGKNFIIGLKLPGDDGVRRSIDPAEAALITAELTAPGNVDYICYAQGSHARTLEMHLPDRYGPRLAYMDLIRRLRGSANGVPVVALGRITDPAEAEKLLRDNAAELIGLGRALIADPAWLAKATQNRTHDIRYCLSCNTCWGTIIGFHTPVVCVNNPRVGRPDEVDFWPLPAAQPRRVVVVGAGIAGLEAAWVAAARGHQVTVFSRSGDVGGKARLRAPLPGGETITSIYDYQYPAALRAGAKFRLGETATPEAVLKEQPDVVILACGSSMIPPDWLPPEPGLVPDLRQAMAALAGRGRQAGTAVVFDMDHTEATYASAEALDEMFDRVVLITPRDTVAVDMQMVTRQGVLRRLAERRIQVVTSAMPVWSDRFEDGILEYENVFTGDRTDIEDVALLTYATPRAADDALAVALERAGIRCIAVGDCLAPGEMLAATASGHAAGESV